VTLTEILTTVGISLTAAGVLLIPSARFQVRQWHEVQTLKQGYEDVRREMERLEASASVTMTKLARIEALLEVILKRLDER
jgi:hypothetical protein